MSHPALLVCRAQEFGQDHDHAGARGRAAARGHGAALQEGPDYIDPMWLTLAAGRPASTSIRS